MFGRTRLRPIADFDFNVSDDSWYGVDRDPQSDWESELTTEAGEGREGKETLLEQLRGIHREVASKPEEAFRSAVWIPQDGALRVACVLTFRVKDASEGGPDTYEADLASWHSSSGLAQEYDAVNNWKVRVDAGIAVGAYGLSASSDSGDDAPGAQASTVFAVFPTGSSQYIEYTFETQDRGLFDDLEEMSMGWVATTTVKLGR